MVLPSAEEKSDATQRRMPKATTTDVLTSIIVRDDTDRRKTERQREWIQREGQSDKAVGMVFVGYADDHEGGVFRMFTPHTMNMIHKSRGVQ